MRIPKPLNEATPRVKTIIRGGMKIAIYEDLGRLIEERRFDSTV